MHRCSRSRRSESWRPRLCLLEDRVLPGEAILGAVVAEQAVARASAAWPPGSAGAAVSPGATTATSVPAAIPSAAAPAVVVASATTGQSAASSSSTTAGVSTMTAFASDPLALDGMTNPLAATADFSQAPVFASPGLAITDQTVVLAGDPAGSVSSLSRVSSVAPVSGPVLAAGSALPIPVLPAGGLTHGAAPQGRIDKSWSTYQQNPAHTGSTLARVDPTNLALAWSAPTGYSVPLIVGKSVIAMKNQQGVGNDVTSIRSFNLKTGAVNWDYTDHFVFPSQPTVSNGLVVFAASQTISSPFTLYVLSAADGTLQYTVPLSNGFDSSVMPTVVTNPDTGDLMAFVATGGSLYAVDLGDTSGTVAWSVTTREFGGFSMPTAVGSSVIVAGPGQFYAYDMTTGQENHFHMGDIEGGGGTTVAYDANLGQFYVLEDYSTSAFGVLTAYGYADNADITQLWQKSGPGLRSVAIAPDDTLYSVDNSTILQIDPSDGSTIRALGGQNIANLVTPELSNSDLWAFSNNQTLIYDLNSLTLAATLPGSRGSLNSAYDSPGALTNRHFVLDYGNIYGSPGFDVYADPAGR